MRLNVSARRTASWASKAESSKSRIVGQKDTKFIDRGFMGHKAAKMMKRSTSVQKRKEKSIEEKSKLLKNIETVDSLKIHPLNHHQNTLIEISNLSIIYDENPIFTPLSFSVESGDRVWLCGKNGCGKSSLIKLILGKNIKFSGNINIASHLKIS